MTKLTLYYPGFAEPDGAPESTEFNSLDDLKKDPAIKDRMFGLLSLRKTFAYEDLTPESGRSGFYKHVFHKASDGGHWGAAIITGNTAEEVTAGLELLGTKAVPSDKW